MKDTIIIYQFEPPESEQDQSGESGLMFDRKIMAEVEENQKLLDEQIKETEKQRRDIERRIFDLHNDTDCFGNCFSDADPGL
jgi:hypothetical protein